MGHFTAHVHTSLLCKGTGKPKAWQGRRGCCCRRHLGTTLPGPGPDKSHTGAEIGLVCKVPDGNYEGEGGLRVRRAGRDLRQHCFPVFLWAMLGVVIFQAEKLKK